MLSLLTIRISLAIKFRCCCNVSVYGYICAPCSGPVRKEVDRCTTGPLMWVCGRKGRCSPKGRGHVVKTEGWRIKGAVGLYWICIRLHGWRFGVIGYFGRLPWCVDGISGYLPELSFYSSRYCGLGTVLSYRWLLFLDCCLPWGCRFIRFTACHSSKISFRVLPSKN